MKTVCSASALLLCLTCVCLAGDWPQWGGLIYCLDEATERLLWRLVVPPRPKDRLPQDVLYGQHHLGACSSVAVVGKRAFVMTGRAEILRLDVNGQVDGKVFIKTNKWRMAGCPHQRHIDSQHKSDASRPIPTRHRPRLLSHPRDYVVMTCATECWPAGWADPS